MPDLSFSLSHRASFSTNTRALSLSLSLSLKSVQAIFPYEGLASLEVNEPAESDWLIGSAFGWLAGANVLVKDRLTGFMTQNVICLRREIGKREKEKKEIKRGDFFFLLFFWHPPWTGKYCTCM